jgi:hypothetical protein
MVKMAERPGGWCEVKVVVVVVVVVLVVVRAYLPSESDEESHSGGRVVDV